MDEQEKAFEEYNRRKAAEAMGNLEAEIQEQDPNFRNVDGNGLSYAFSEVKKIVRKRWAGQWRDSDFFTQREIDLRVTYSNHQLQVSGRYRTYDSTNISVKCSGDWSSTTKTITQDTSEILFLDLDGRNCPTLKRIHPKQGRKSCFIDQFEVPCP